MINKYRYSLIVATLTTTLLLSSCQKPPQRHEQKNNHATAHQTSTQSVMVSDTIFKSSPPLVVAARAQVGVTTSYDPRYLNIPFPMGDVDKGTGVCTDVVIRAYRTQGKDLQQLVNTDMKKAWNAYPKTWGLTQPDTNIDHRRVPNLEVFFARHGKQLSLSDKSSFKAGDLVTWRLNQGNKKLPHIGIVSDRKAADGTPLILHNIGRGTEESDVLYKFPITGHYRY